MPYTFAGNHDVTRLASRLTDERHLPHALVVLLTLGGTPSIYPGDEQGFRGVKRNGSVGTTLSGRLSLSNRQLSDQTVAQPPRRAAS